MVSQATAPSWLITCFLYAQLPVADFLYRPISYTVCAATCDPDTSFMIASCLMHSSYDSRSLLHLSTFLVSADGFMIWGPDAQIEFFKFSSSLSYFFLQGVATILSPLETHLSVHLLTIFTLGTLFSQISLSL